MEDQRIIELYQKRDEKAIVLTKEIYGKKLRSLAMGILENKEDTEECENDTYLKVWHSIPPQEPRYFFAYLAKICRNTALHILEKKNADKRSAVVVELTKELSECLPDNGSFGTVEDCELGELLTVFLKQVKQGSRVIFIRRYFMSESVSTIAQQLGISESKVKSTLFRTRKKLKEYLLKEEL